MSDTERLKKEIFSLVEKYAKQKITGTTFVPGKTDVPPSGKSLGVEEFVMMVDAVLDGWLTSGRFNREFERRLAEIFGLRFARTVNSGSSANLVAFSALTSPKLGDRAIKPGDEVITVAAGFPTTVNPILQFGATPVFVDVQLETYNIDDAQIEEAITNKTRAIMLAHTLGNPFNVGRVRDICERYGLWLVEDCCDAFGSTFQGANVGTFGNLATLSFYPAHHITMGEGGAVLTNDTELKSITESFRDWGRDCYCDPGCDNTCGKRFDWKLGDLPHGYDHKYTYSHLGYNLKITDLQAACGLAQLGKVHGFVNKRRANFKFLKESLAACEEFLYLPRAAENADPSWFGFPLTIRDTANVDRESLLLYLNERKIGTRLLFAGNLTRQPYMQGRKFRIQGDLQNTDKVMKDTFWIGLQPGLNEEMLDYSSTAINQYFGLNFD